MLYIKQGLIRDSSNIVVVKNGIQYINPPKEMIQEIGWEEYHTPELTLQQVKDIKIQELTLFDTSDQVNQVYLNDLPLWLSKEDRVGLVNSTNSEINAGRETTKLWTKTIPPISVTFKCQDLLDMLEKMEIYALECYNTTSQHKANICALETVEEVNSYDFTAGYPEKPKFYSQS